MSEMVKHHDLCGWTTHETLDCVCQELTEVERLTLAAAVARVEALHVRTADTYGIKPDYCDYCWLDNYGDSPLPWPCPTVVAVRGDDTP